MMNFKNQFTIPFFYVCKYNPKQKRTFTVPTILSQFFVTNLNVKIKC